jgi:hypothetical protein
LEKAYNSSHNDNNKVHLNTIIMNIAPSNIRMRVHYTMPVNFSCL